MSYIGSELRKLRKENVRLNRKLALQRIPGKVVARKGRMVQLDIGEDPETGKRILSPWVRVQSLSAGKFKAFVLPSIDEQLYLESPSGIVGADSLATFGSFDDENRQPDQDEDEMVIEAGQTRLSVKDGELKISVGGTSMTFTASGLKTVADRYDLE